MTDRPNDVPERRVFRRTDLTHRIEIQLRPEGDEEPDTIDGSVVNLGCGGLLVRVEELVDEGTSCIVRFLHSHSDVETEQIEGTVVRSQHEPEGTCLLGVEFARRLERVRSPSTVDYVWQEATWAPTRGLVVDDEEDVRTLLARFLSARGCDVDTAADGEEAMERLREDPPDLMILDIRMPRMDGIEVLTAIREEDIDVDPIIVVSGYATDDEGVQALELGVADFINKPFDLQYLEWSLQMHLVGSAQVESERGNSA